MKDEAGEEQYKINLRELLNKVNVEITPLFTGMSFYILPNAVFPKKQDLHQLAAVIETAGGKVYIYIYICLVRAKISNQHNTYCERR